MESKDLTTLYGYCQRVNSQQECQENKAQDDTGSKYGPYPSIKTKITQHQKMLTEQEMKELAEAYRSGKTVYELAKMFGCNRETVSIRLKASGVKMRRQPATDEQIEQMVELYEAGHSCAKIGKILNLNPSVVWRMLKQVDIKLRGSHERAGNQDEESAKGHQNDNDNDGDKVSREEKAAALNCNDVKVTVW